MKIERIYPKEPTLIEVNGRTVEALYIAVEATENDIHEKYSKNNSMRKSKGSKHVNCYGEKSGLLLGSYESITEASQKTGLDISNISKACNGKIPSLGGMTWEFRTITP